MSLLLDSGSLIPPPSMGITVVGHWSLCNQLLVGCLFFFIHLYTADNKVVFLQLSFYHLATHDF